jgi:uroporphyrinogen-III synthase
MLVAMPAPWRVAITRDEGPDGPLGRALDEVGFATCHCLAAEEHPPADPAPLAAAARELQRYDWAVFSSRRGVNALTSIRREPWPRGLRTAAVGTSTAAALVAAGADPAPLVAADAGADALWALLEASDRWPGKRVLVPAVAGGRRTVIEGLLGAGAAVAVIEAYRMLPRAAGAIAADWSAAAPDAVVFASPSAVDVIIEAVGRDRLAALEAVVAIGPTTAAALDSHGVLASVSPAADFTSVARHLAGVHASARAGKRHAHG